VTNLKGNRRMWPQIVHGKFPFLPWTSQWLDKS
jgi:hypothetical protein